MTEHVRTLSRATIASGVATATEIGLLWLLVHPLKVPRWVAFWVVQFYCNAATFLLYKYWAFDAAEGRIQRKNVWIRLQNEAGEKVWAWQLDWALPVKWSCSDLDAGQSQVVMESLELAHHGLSKAT